MVRQLKDAASSTASQTITTAASGESTTLKAPFCAPPNEIWLSAISIETMAASAAVRLIAVTARILPISTWLRGAGVRRRLSSVFRSRSPADVSRAADSPPVRLIVIRMYGKKKLKNELPAALVGELGGCTVIGRGSSTDGSTTFGCRRYSAGT